MKRLLCILDSLDTGGAETFMMKLYRAMDRTEYQLDFIVCKDGCYDKEVLEKGGRIYKIPLRTKEFFKAFSGIRRTVKENGYENVLKLGSSPKVVTDLFAARLGGARKICLRSCNAPTTLGRKQKLIDAALRPSMNALAKVKIAPSDLAALYTFGEKQVKAGRVHILKNAVDLDYYKRDEAGAERVREEFGLKGKFVVGHIGRLNKQKNHAFLIEIFAAVARLKPESALLLIGVGELEDDIRAKARSLGIADKVIFAGRRSDIPALLSAMDVFVFPSLYEGMPNTIIEAQAVGVPCVASDAITKGANVTGALKYLSLEAGADEWAKAAIEAGAAPRADMSAVMREKGYSIEGSVKEFIKLCY